ncbi:MAG TPA: metal ABC transporter ATP-binding protein [Candidatus Aquilonibacter sp.]|nr:metal ABC transporter ATP-binding protein [Candidatus Aquilonibacter sp.]
MNDKLIQLDKVCFSYDKEHVLEDVSFSINKGEIIGIAGPNGSGKTTMLKLIVGLLKPQGGRVEIFGNGTVPSIGPHAAIGYLSQNIQKVDYAFPATVEEIVGTGLYGKIGILGRPSDSDKAAIENAIKNVGLERFRNVQITRLSGGQLQRAFIARALVSNPSLLILDEPTAAVDLAGEEKFYGLIKEVNRLYGVAVLLVSHDVYALIDHTDRLIFVNKKILYDGKSHDISSKKLLELLFYHKHSKKLIKLLEGGRKRELGEAAGKP